MKRTNNKHLKISKLLRVCLILSAVALLIALAVQEIRSRKTKIPEGLPQSNADNPKVIPTSNTALKPFVTEFGGFTYTFPPGAFGDYQGVIDISAFSRHKNDFDQKYRHVADSMVLAGSMREPKQVSLKSTFEVKTTYDPSFSKHIDKSKLVFLYTPDSPGYEHYPWIELPTSIDNETRTVTGTGSKLGNFVLVGPLICPSDPVEPDDNYDQSNLINKSQYGYSIKMIFDIPGDENWVRFLATKGKTYRLETINIFPNVNPIIKIFDPGGVDKIAEAQNMIEWTPPQELFTQSPEVNYFVSINSTQNSKTGCDATFDLVLTEFIK